jgi:hypothetical protein
LLSGFPRPPFAVWEHRSFGSFQTNRFLNRDEGHGGQVSLGDGQIQVNQRPPEKDFIAQILRNTAWLSEQLEEELGTKVWIKPILVFANAFIENPGLIRNIQVIPKAYLLNTILRSSRSGGAWKLWKRKEVLAEIFPTIWFPLDADLDPSPPPLPPSPPPMASSSLALATSCVPKSSSLPPSPDTAPTLPKELPSPIRRTPMGAVYRLGSSDDLKPAEVEEIDREDK